MCGSPVQALPPQPNPRPKREGSAASFVSPLDHAAAASSTDSGSSLTGSSLNSGNLSQNSQSASGFNFYQVEEICQAYHSSQGSVLPCSA